VVPFYLQPTLGSDLELRGFRRYRFYDENSVALTGEYRWEINTAFDMALFVDGGRVFHRPGELSLSALESSVGFGFRVKNRRSVIARLDTGFSREGCQVWLKVGKLF
jgi:hemolysin activation/secretion protein